MGEGFSSFTSPKTGASSALALEARLVEEACGFYGVDPKQLSGIKRGYYTKVRWALILVLTNNVGWSENRVATFLNKRVFAVQEGRKQAAKQLRTDPLFFEIVDRLRRSICST